VHSGVKEIPRIWAEEEQGKRIKSAKARGGQSSTIEKNFGAGSSGVKGVLLGGERERRRNKEIGYCFIM